MSKVLLVSFNDFFDSPVEIPSMFKQAGLHVSVFCCKTSWLRSNVFHDEWIPASKEKKDFVKEYITFLQKHSDDYDKIMLLDDETIKIIHEALPPKDGRLFKKTMPLLKMENAPMLSSKIGMSSVFMKYGIDTPRYVNLAELEDISTIPSLVNFPVLLKVDFSFSGLGIRKCDNPSHLETLLEELHDQKNVIIQEFIEGDDIGVEALFHEGKLIEYQAAKVELYMENKFSVTSQRIYFRSKRIEKLLTELGEKLGLNSFASIGYMYHQKQDLYYLIEVDARTNAWMPYSKFTNHSFSDALKRVFYHTPKRQLTQEEENKTFKIILFDRDFRRCIKKKDFKELAKWIFNLDGRWKFIPFYDRKYLSRIILKMIKDFVS